MSHFLPLNITVSLTECRGSKKRKQFSSNILICCKHLSVFNITLT